MTATIDIVKQGIALSQQSLLLAEAEDWDAFTALEHDRQSLLKAVTITSEEMSPEQIDVLRIDMQQLIELNVQLEKACLQHRNVAAKELQKFQKNSKAHKAYSE